MIMFNTTRRRASFREKTVVVTGASAGIGRAVAARFARAGARLGLIAREQTALTEIKSELETLGVQVCTVAADAADAQALFDAAEKFERELGPIAVWVNAAMVTVFSPVVKTTPEEFRRVMEVTYLGFVNGTLAALKHMQPRNEGSIIQIGSALAYRGIPLQSAYCGAKFAIRGFTEALRAELLHDKCQVTVSMIQLPGINTPQFEWARTHVEYQPRPVAPVLQPSVPAEAAFKAASEGLDEYWIGNTASLLILGNMIFPRLMARYLAKTAYRGQQTDEPVSASRPDNLFSPAHRYHRTNGRFSSEARISAPIYPAGVARMAVLFGGTALTIALGYVFGRRDRPRLTNERRF